MQGFNMGRYVPPDVEGTISGNALNKKHALGARASKLRTEGILTVRFEMPFGVWCGTCPKPTIIGQGVRFNAEKKKVGAYHSTPIWSFRMRHADCGGVIEIRTDPANAEYVVAEGGTRRDTGDDKDDSLVSSSALIGGLGEILTGKEKDALRNDAFARLEKTIEDRGVLIERSHRIAELEDASHRAWEDPYTQNRRLRAAFRTGRKAREKEAASTEELQERMSLGIDLLPATEADARRAALVDFGVVAALGRSETEPNNNSTASPRTKDPALLKPLFRASAAVGTKNSTPGAGMDTPSTNSKAREKKGKKPLKSEIKASQTREFLASEITRNARASQDPFLVTAAPILPWSGGGGGGGGGEGGVTVSKGIPRIQGIKRKRPDQQTRQHTTPTSAPISNKHPKQDALAEEEEEQEEESGVGVGVGVEGEGIEKGHPGSSADRTSKGGGGDAGDETGNPTGTSLKTTLVEYDSD